jgi:hypothetical protein
MFASPRTAQGPADLDEGLALSPVSINAPADEPTDALRFFLSVRNDSDDDALADETSRPSYNAHTSQA